MEPQLVPTFTNSIPAKKSNITAGKGESMDKTHTKGVTFISYPLE